MEDKTLLVKNEKELEILIKTIRIYSQYIGMEFGIEKCAIFIMKKEKREVMEIRTNYSKAKIDYMLQNSKCNLFGERDETINHVKSECCKLVPKKYKTRDDWVRKVVLGKLHKKFQFNQTNKWYMRKPESVLENETHKIIWDFEIQTNHQISVRRLDFEIIVKKENLAYRGLYRHGGPLRGNQRKRKERQVFRSSQKAKKVVEYEDEGNTNYECHNWNGPQCFGKGSRRVGNQKTNRDFPDYRIVKTG